MTTPGFTEDWFSFGSCRSLTRLARRTDSVRGRVVEIGCWEGKSTCVLANAVHPVVVHAVDTWDGSPGEISEQLAAEEGRDVLATFVANVEHFTRGNVCLHRGDWRDYNDDSPVRFLHIDATHTYTEVHDTITAYLPLMAPGGIICGDDRHHPPVITAAHDVLGDVDSASTLWFWEAPHHGGT